MNIYSQLLKENPEDSIKQSADKAAELFSLEKWKEEIWYGMKRSGAIGKYAWLVKIW